MHATIETAPAAEPIDADAAANWLRLDTDVAAIDADLAARLVTAAREYCEHYCDRAFALQEWRVERDRLAECTLPGGQVGAVVSFEYETPDGDTATLDASVYTLSRDGRLRLKRGQHWPAHHSGPDTVQIVYEVGSVTVPEDVCLAIRFHLGYGYENRQGGSERIKWADVAPALHAQLHRHRIMSL